MHSPDLHRLLAQARSTEFRRAAARSGRPGGGWDQPPLPRPAVALGVTLRFAFPDDAGAVARLAQLDCAEVPAAPLLLAEVGGELWAALSLTDGSVIADPFHLTAGHVALLRERAAQLTSEPTRRPRMREWVTLLGLRLGRS